MIGDEFLKGIYSHIEPTPHYKGDGVHSVKELQELCKNFTERCHQQMIIKQGLIEEVKNSRKKTNDSGPWLTNGNNDFPEPNTYVEPWESMGR